MGGKPHHIMWAVLTNIHVVNKRVAGRAAVNMSEVVIRWFSSLRSKAISNLAGTSYLLKEEKSKDKFLRGFCGNF